MLPERLTALAADIDWPETPDLAQAVLARLESEPAPARPPRRRRRSLLIVLAVLLLGGGGTLAVSPGARSAVLEFLGLGGAVIERGTPRPGLSSDFDLGRAVRSLADARAAVGFDVPAPSGDPRIFVDRTLPGGRVTFDYGDGLTVTLVEGRVEPVIQKIIRPRAKIERLTVDGLPGFWIADLHEFAFIDRTGDVRSDTVRLAGPTLLQERPDGLLVRIEGAASKQAALELAPR